MKFPAALIAGLLSFATIAVAQLERIATTVDNGGGRLSSANYTIDSAINQSGQLTTAAPDFLAKSGYAGQLYDAVAVQVNLVPPTISETSTRQLGTALMLDDETLLPLAPSDVSWSIAGGPLALISTGGAVTAGTVYEDTNASLVGEFADVDGHLALTVLNVGSDDFGSYAGDGLDDDWQVAFFGLDNPDAAPERDPDVDDQDNLFEFTAGLIPTDPTSRFRLRVEKVAAEPTQRNLVFDPIVSGRTYAVESSPALVPVNWSPLPGSPPISDNGTERTVTDLDASGAFKIYRVRITRP